MTKIYRYLSLIALSVLVAPLVITTSIASSTSSSESADHQAIEAVLVSYTRCVSDRDETGFRALLLDDKVTFAYVGALKTATASTDLRQYEGFRQAIFASGQRYRQRFYNIHIEQQGPLAQVSLNFVTARASGDPHPSPGWKVLQLVKTHGQWKIVSELYTFDS